jgi:hypothetical protein
MISWRVARELELRGYGDVAHCRREFGGGILDPDLFAKVGSGAVLITADIDMLIEEDSAIQRLRPTLAIVDLQGQPDTLNANAYTRDVIHRHAHRIVEQEPQSIYVYRRPRRRRVA